MRNYLAIVAFCMLAGCAPQGMWVKDGASQQQANQDHYACIQARGYYFRRMQ